METPINSMMPPEQDLPILGVWGEWVLYPIPDQTRLIKHLESNPERQEKLRKRLRRRATMNFTAAMMAIKKGRKARRPQWDKDMWIWWSGDFTIHTHPYDEHQATVPKVRGYFYVVEKDDAIAEDWECVAI